MPVEQAMTADPTTCPAGESLRTGVERMLRNRVGSVIVHRDDAPAGIVTTPDTVGAYHELKADIDGLLRADQSWSLDG